MGVADIVPGFSGGTMCFIMGIYDDLLRSINSFNTSSVKLLWKGQFRAFFNHVGWEFLLTLGIGVLFTLITISGLIHSILGHEVYRIYLYSLFTGLVIGAIFFCARKVKSWDKKTVFASIIAALFAFSIANIHLKVQTSRGPLFDVPIDHELSSQTVSWEKDHMRHIENYNSETKELLNIDQNTVVALLGQGVIQADTMVFDKTHDTQVSVATLSKGNNHNSFLSHINFWMIFCGAIAITAFLLPGMSGSYILNALGAYPTVIGALAEFTNGIKRGVFLADEFSILGHLVIGIAIGILLFSRVAHWLIRNYYNITVASMIGLMAGSIKTIWPFHSYSYILNPLKLSRGPMLIPGDPILPSTSEPTLYFAILFVIIGFSLILTIENIASGRRRKLM